MPWHDVEANVILLTGIQQSYKITMAYNLYLVLIYCAIMQALTSHQPSIGPSWCGCHVAPCTRRSCDGIWPDPDNRFRSNASHSCKRQRRYWPCSPIRRWSSVAGGSRAPPLRLSPVSHAFSPAIFPASSAYYIRPWSRHQCTNRRHDSSRNNDISHPRIWGIYWKSILYKPV